MRKLFISFIFCFALTIIFGQEKFKFGTVTPGEFETVNIATDSLAPAIVLYEYCNTYFDITENKILVVTNYITRIKILTTDGVEQANGSFILYIGKGSENKESYSGLDGFTYNLENGSIRKDKLSKKYIFTENLSETRQMVKFALPAVKPGSIIEYKYTIKSPFYGNSRSYTFQRDIPVKYSYFAIKIPEYFSFDKETKGYEPLITNITQENASFFLYQQAIPYTAEVITIEAKDLPALKPDDFVYHYQDYLSGIRLELRQFAIPGSVYKNFSVTWNDVVRQLNENDSFGDRLKYKNLFKNDIPAIVKPELSEREKIKNILDLVRIKVKWDKTSTCYITDPPKALKNGIGSSGEINALLLCALKDAGFNAYPVVMSLRSRGRIPITYPSLDQLNYFIVAVESENNTYYLDATRPYTDLNVLPVDCLVSQALCIFPDRFSWVDLSNISNNRVVSNFSISFNEHGQLSGKYLRSTNNEAAYDFQNKYHNAKGRQDYIKQLEEEYKIQISNYDTNILSTNNSSVNEIFAFIDPNISLNDHQTIIFSPLLFSKMINNPFKQEKRNLPVEFPYAYSDRINIVLTIPDGYEFDEIPTSMKFIYEDELASFTYVVKKEQNKLQIFCIFNMGTTIIPVNQYSIFRDFYAKIYAKTNEPIVIKKIAK